MGGTNPKPSCRQDPEPPITAHTFCRTALDLGRPILNGVHSAGWKTSSITEPCRPFGSGMGPPSRRGLNLRPAAGRHGLAFGCEASDSSCRVWPSCSSVRDIPERWLWGWEGPHSRPKPSPSLSESRLSPGRRSRSGWPPHPAPHHRSCRRWRTQVRPRAAIPQQPPGRLPSWP